MARPCHPSGTTATSCSTGKSCCSSSPWSSSRRAAAPLNTQVFFLPGGATSSWREGPVPQQCLGEAKSTDQSAGRVLDTLRGQGAFLTPCGSRRSAQAASGHWGQEAPAKPPRGAQDTPAKAPRGGPGHPGNGGRTPRQVPGFRVYTFVIATSVRVITCRVKQLWRPSVSALPEPPDLCHQSLADRSDGFGLPGWVTSPQPDFRVRLAKRRAGAKPGQQMLILS